MSFFSICKQYENLDLNRMMQHSNANNILRVLEKDDCTMDDFINLLSQEAENHLEAIAQKARQLTLQNFGKTIQLYTPLYLSNHCDNVCSYCGFNALNKSKRKKLSTDQLKKEAEFIYSTGIKHILILTGDSKEKTPIGYIKECVEVLKSYFSSISIEVYALTEEEYALLIKAGIDGITIYQEVYDQDVYKRVHLKGPKKDYNFRINAAERALKQGIRTVNIGALLGLNDWRKEIFFTGLHAKYLQDKYTFAEIGVSVPRLRPHLGSFENIFTVTDKNLTQAILALRVFLPRIGITLSTREKQELRDNLLGLGITRISAASTTAVGGHTLDYKHKEEEQFEISDKRDLDQIKQMLKNKKYQPVLKDWMHV